MLVENPSLATFPCSYQTDNLSSASWYKLSKGCGLVRLELIWWPSLCFANISVSE
uniref:Predicted protein n=1 Tax=Hordeum vulgare subsp. vulgare TaxID=112509 RepID=F2EB35_HORVV|nr:predicted protein [Hordeum vulgare subsp. vulgare]